MKVLGPGSVNTNWGPGSLNTNWDPGSVNTNWRPGSVNTNSGPGSVNTKWGPGPGSRVRARGQTEDRGRANANTQLLTKNISRKVPPENICRATRCYLPITIEFGNSILSAYFLKNIFIWSTNLYFNCFDWTTCDIQIVSEYQTDDCGGV